MNEQPNQTNKNSPYKKAGSLNPVNDQQYEQKNKFQHHGVIAAILMFTAILIRFGVPIFSMTEASENFHPQLFFLSILGATLWVWGAIHLALHFNLGAAWGLWGLLFLLGLGVIFWAANQRPKWEQQKARRSQNRKRPRNNSDSLY